MAPNDPIVICDYDPGWPARFAAERDLLLGAIGRGFGVQHVDHVGSTSVPGLAAKPVIDISLGVADLELARGIVPVLEPLGYTYEPQWEDELPFRLYLRRGTPRSVHLHVTESNHPFRLADIAFRDRLRAHPEVARRYEQLKRDLALRYPDDRIAYTMAKTGFVMREKELAGAPTWRP